MVRTREWHQSVGWSCRPRHWSLMIVTHCCRTQATVYSAFGTQAPGSVSEQSLRNLYRFTNFTWRN
ncbi:hypothetical protein BRARA_D01472 [Brassica rapa]|uniref:Uncharacterized protein n=1 Tax=Brassica campestris TaxID=3711 RepID=A0A397ZSD1_BRACM|nr:hypothetical protein BRARA_D01472 [Brassica rapa]RID66318.1 hypothetical protein BRARA_D01472 [Brassica rapa]RID66319.1 hypothetical protein BRARA_D01472 [Brassica rapa]RID66320.1 hypothetical protein BRARA_D01472 [Brassica rapa]